MNVKQAAVRRLERTGTGKRLLREQRFRVFFFAAIGLLINVIYAVYHGALGIANKSVWFAAMCAYYIMLSAMRASAVLCEWKRKPADFDDTAYFVAKLCGGLLVILSFILAGIVYISLFQNVAVKHDTIVMITIATYTFYKITVAIIRAVRQCRDTAPLPMVIRAVGYAEVAVSLLTLQRSMLVSFGGMNDADIGLMNSLTGSAVCLFILLLGILTILRSSRERKKDGTI